MNKLSNVVYKRLLAQAEEARDLKLENLADSVLSALGPMTRDEEETFEFSYAELRNNVHRSLWKIAIDVVAYHDYQKSDIQKIEATITDLTDAVLVAIRGSLNSSDKIGPNEPKLPGQSK
jgi:hypothetical protein